jgi:hypothetical protein
LGKGIIYLVLDLCNKAIWGLFDNYLKPASP